MTMRAYNVKPIPEEGTKMQTYTDTQIKDWDAESMAFGYKRGPLDRPSFLPEFWNEAQAEAHFAGEVDPDLCEKAMLMLWNDPRDLDTDLAREAHAEMEMEGEVIAREEAECLGWSEGFSSFIDGRGNGSGRW